MAIKTFAAIDVGSFEMAMKIFEISAKCGMREIDYIRHHLALGSDTYNTKKIGYEKMDELCRILREFQQIMKTYGVTDYRAYGTSAIREAENTLIILDQIRNRTGVEIQVLSNSEQRFLDYKSIASKGEEFRSFIGKGTAIVDIGGGTIQLSLFENDSLVTTQNVKIGVLRLHELLMQMRPKPGQQAAILDEMMDSQLSVFKKMYLKDRIVSNLIVMDDYISGTIKGQLAEGKNGVVSKEVFGAFADSFFVKSREALAETYAVAEENVELMGISARILSHVMEMMNAETIWAPGVTLCDGIAYEYAEKKRINMTRHDFEKDIIACAKNISKRYMGSRKRSEVMEETALTIFDSMKKVHGMSKRERLLLQLAAIMHDCGKFINMTDVGMCSYSIIMHTEMIGLSHREREIVAYVARFIHDDFSYYDEMAAASDMNKETYLIIAKLTAIIRIANGLDKSHKQKFKKFKASLEEERLILTVEGKQDIMYEQAIFRQRSDFFEEVFSIEPVIKQKKMD
ncbi:MAG: exopolyphosphatase [Lachnospiraceae bacterium]|nr:exopolyphosphatase [Lachnospiraceae bacterium]MBQ8261455.1 exopolyphosphatase [Lachnospiraceae bacterium]